MAKGATETGKVEAYMCNKISRNPLVANCCAQFLGSFTSPATDGAEGQPVWEGVRGGRSSHHLRLTVRAGRRGEEGEAHLTCD